MSIKEKQLFLQKLEETVLSNSEVKQLQLRSLFQTFSKKKPKTEIIRFIEKPKNIFLQGLNQYNDEINYESYKILSENQCERKIARSCGYNRKIRRQMSNTEVVLEFEAFDHIKQKHILLQVHFFNPLKRNIKSKLKQLIDVVSTFGNQNILLQPLAFYSLRSDLDYFNEEDSFFAIEFEMYHTTFNELCSSQLSMYSQNDIKNIINIYSKYCQEITKIWHHKWISPFQLMSDLYIIINDSGEAQLKFDLIHKDNEYRAMIYDYELRNHSNEVEVEISPEQKEEIFVNKKPLQKMQIEKDKNYFEEFLKHLYLLISKDNLVQRLKETLKPSQFNSHDPAIFEMIQQNPKYNQFELFTFGKNEFIFKVNNNKGGESFILQGKKYESLLEAERVYKQYQSLIASASSSFHSSEMKQITTITEAYFVCFEQYSYILIEKQAIFQKELDKLNIIVLLKKNFATKDAQLSMIYYASILKCLIELSYSLFINNDIDISTVNPFGIVLGRIIQDQLSKQSEIGELIIQDFNQGRFEEIWMKKIVTQLFETQPFNRNTMEQILVIFQSYFDAISRNNKEQVLEQYQYFQEKLIRLDSINRLILNSYLILSDKIFIECQDVGVEKIKISIMKNLTFEDTPHLRKIMSETQFNYFSSEYSFDLMFKTYVFSIEPFFKNQQNNNNNNYNNFNINVQDIGLQNNFQIEYYYKKNLGVFFSGQGIFQTFQNGLYDFMKKCSSNLKIIVDIVYRDINLEDIQLWKYGQREYQFDNTIDSLKQCLSYLSITFLPYKDIELKIVLTHNSFISLLNTQHPLEGIYCNPTYQINFQELLIQNARYKNVKSSFLSTQKCYCCDFKESFDSELSILQNQTKSLKQIDFCVNLSKFCCDNHKYSSILKQFLSIQFLKIRLQAESFEILDINNTISIFKFLFHLFNSLHHLNTLTILSIHNSVKPIIRKLKKLKRIVKILNYKY